MVKTRCSFKPTRIDDIKYLCSRLRQDDVNEITALCSTPLNSLLDGYMMSDECYTVFVDSEPAGMFGVASTGGVAGSIWFLGTPIMDKVPRVWIEMGRFYINHFLKSYPVLTNVVSIENTKHIQWLKRLGAKFSNPIKFNNHQFKEFYLFR